MVSRILAVALAAGLLSGGAAMAEGPERLGDADLDRVTAGVFNGMSFSFARSGAEGHGSSFSTSSTDARFNETVEQNNGDVEADLDAGASATGSAGGTGPGYASSFGEGGAGVFVIF